MAKTGLHLGGRPYLVAEIPFNDTWIRDLMFEFRKVVRPLTYRELMAISRQYHFHYWTIYNWQHGRTNPSVKIMKEIVNWAKLGKPMRRVQPGTISRGSML